MQEFCKGLPVPEAWKLERDLFVHSLRGGYYLYTYTAVSLLQALGNAQPGTQLDAQSLLRSITTPQRKESDAEQSKNVVLSRLQDVTLKVPDDVQGGMRCYRCGSNDLLVEMHQTRSADEGMTQYVTCNGCGSKW